jgi:hypothetical protein
VQRKEKAVSEKEIKDYNGLSDVESKRVRLKTVRGEIEIALKYGRPGSATINGSGGMFEHWIKLFDELLSDLEETTIHKKAMRGMAMAIDRCYCMSCNLEHVKISETCIQCKINYFMEEVERNSQ